jgi:hypothetical protein
MIEMSESFTTDVNIMEQAHGYPLCWVHSRHCANGLAKGQLTQHNGLPLARSIIHKAVKA